MQRSDTYVSMYYVFGKQSECVQQGRCTYLAVLKVNKRRIHRLLIYFP